MDKEFPFSVIGKVVLDPSKRLEKSSKTLIDPTDHAVNMSASTLWIVSLNSSNVFVGSVGIPTVPPTPIVNI